MAARAPGRQDAEAAKAGRNLLLLRLIQETTISSVRPCIRLADSRMYRDKLGERVPD